jgi:hypothetical protein
LPTRYNDGRLIEEENYLWAGEQLAVRFGAYTFEPQPVRGVWMRQGLRYEENNLRVFVDVESTAENEAFFHDFKETLKRRFNQIDIWIVSYDIRIT